MKINLTLGGVIAAVALAGCLQKKSSSAQGAPTDAAQLAKVNGPSAECQNYVLPAGSLPSKHWDWLSMESDGKTARNQDSWDKVFKCALMPVKLPVGEGVGHGAVRATGIADIDRLQDRIRAKLWGGKILTLDPGTKQITLLNHMLQAGDLRYNARVRGNTAAKDDTCDFCTGSVDGKQSVILDYRIDKTGETTPPPVDGQPNVIEAILDPIIHSVRDEIREVQVLDAAGNMSGSGLFIGRANVYKDLGKFFQVGGLDDLLAGNLIVPSRYAPSDDEARSGDAYILGANFSLDFSPNAQVAPQTN